MLRLLLIEEFLFVIVNSMIQAVMFDAGGVLHILVDRRVKT